MQFRQAQLICQTLVSMVETDAERQLLAKLKVALPTAAKVFENTWEQIQRRDLVLDAAAIAPWADDAPNAGNELFRYLRCACLMAEQRNWSGDADTIAEAAELTLEKPNSFHVCRAMAKAMGGDTSAAHQLLNDDTSDEVVQLAAASALMVAGDPGWRAIVDRTLSCSHDSETRQTGLALLQAGTAWT